jgi:low temperature requirement protein LtrA
MLERCRLFLLIALGETVFTTGIAIADAPVGWMTIITGTAALAGTVALWALGFGRADRLTIQYVEETGDPIRATRLAGNALTMMVAGLIAVAVANKQVITHPNEPMSVAVALLFSGPVLFLLVEGWYLWAVPHVWPRLRLIGSAVAPVPHK